MTSSLLTLTLAVLVSGGEPAKATPREPNPFAPSLPLLTDEEEARLDEVIDRFIKYDSGQLAGEGAAKARQDFDRLGPEAIPALIRGMNAAARIEHSCPAVTIARKLARMLAATDDVELLQYARENIGLGVTQSSHLGVLRDLRTGCMLRQNQLARLAEAGARSLRAMSSADLAGLAGREHGPRLKQVLSELAQRRGDEPIDALGAAAADAEGDLRQAARALLDGNLARQGADVVRAKLTDDRAEVRAAAARVVGTRFPALAGDVINLLTDKDADVRAAAHQALVRLNHGTDLGPGPKASDSERDLAVLDWRDWWARRGGRK